MNYSNDYIDILRETLKRAYLEKNVGDILLAYQRELARANAAAQKEEEEEIITTVEKEEEEEEESSDWWMYSLFFCAFFLWFIPLILCALLLSEVHELQDQVNVLNLHVEGTEASLSRSTNAIAVAWSAISIIVIITFCRRRNFLLTVKFKLFKKLYK